MSKHATSATIRLAPELLELLRRADGVVKLEQLALTRPCSMATRRRTVYYLRDLGAPIGSEAGGGKNVGGYWLEDKGWQMPGTQVTVLTQDHVREVERVVFTGDLGAAKIADMVRAIELRGYQVTLRPMEKTG